MMEFLIAVVSSFLGALGFGMLLRAPKRSLPVGAAIGALGYTVYWALGSWGVTNSIAMFLGALIAAALSQLAARRLQMISTIFVTIAILPLVPGLGLYRAMSAWGSGQTMIGSNEAVESMTLILMIALGVAIGSALFGSRPPVQQKPRP